MDKLIIVILIVTFIIGVSKLGRSNQIQYEQQEDYRYGAVKGYSQRFYKRNREFKDNMLIVNITKWIIRIIILYFILSGKMNEFFWC